MWLRCFRGWQKSYATKLVASSRALVGTLLRSRFLQMPPAIERPTEQYRPGCIAPSRNLDRYWHRGFPRHFDLLMLR